MNNIKMHIYVLWVLLLVSMPLVAEQPTNEVTYNRHSIRLGWGEAFLSTSSYDFTPLYGMTLLPVYPTDIQPALEHIVGMPALEADQYLRDYQFVELGQMTSPGHFYIGYNYQLTPLVSLGVDMDYLYMRLPTHWYNGYHTLLTEQLYDQLHHITVMPNIRFTYFRQRILELYSAVGFGCSFYNFSVNNYVGLSLNTTVLGARLGAEHWFAEVELGSMQSWALGCPVQNGLYGSRLFCMAVGYRF